MTSKANTLDCFRFPSHLDFSRTLRISLVTISSKHYCTNAGKEMPSVDYFRFLEQALSEIKQKKACKTHSTSLKELENSGWTSLI